MSFVQLWKRKIDKKYRIIYKRGPSTLAMFFAGIAFAAWIGFLLSTGFPVAQYAYYRVRPATSAVLSKLLSQTITKAEEEHPSTPADKPDESEAVIDASNLPPQDVSLPEGHYLTIPKIRIDTVIWEGPTDNYEEYIKKGVWRAPDLADPENATVNQPVLLVAHRFGYLEWSNEYRRKNSFFNLPKLAEEDEIEIVWNQRRYKYKVTGVEEGEEIGSYQHDLILYTCKFLVSPLRIFVYADRVN